MMSQAEIGKELNIPRRTVSGFLQRLHQENLPRIGRRRKSSNSDERYLVYAPEVDTDQMLKELCNVSIQTIQWLGEVGIQMVRDENEH